MVVFSLLGVVSGLANSLVVCGHFALYRVSVGQSEVVVRNFGWCTRVNSLPPFWTTNQ